MTQQRREDDHTFPLPGSAADPEQRGEIEPRVEETLRLEDSVSPLTADDGSGRQTVIKAADEADTRQGEAPGGNAPAAAGRPVACGPLPQIPGYEVLEEIGRGGVGVVYRARQNGLGRIVALKMLLAGSHAGPQELQRFRSEAEAAARLKHPNVVQIYEVDECDGKPFFSLEYVDGGSLEDALGGRPLPPRQAAAIIETLARTLQHAHASNIVHRDLKPANVLLTREGQPRITDFGLARRLDAPGPHTVTGALIGTPRYMSPEQAAGRSREVGPATDIHALGVILYEALTGRLPFEGASLLQALEQIRSRDPDRLGRSGVAVHPDLETICLKCLQKDPRARYPTAGALADDLRRFLDGEPIQARPIGRLERGWRWVRRRPTAAALALLALLTLLVVLPGWVWYETRLEASRARRQEAEARARFQADLAEMEARARAEAQRAADLDHRLAQTEQYSALLHRVRRRAVLRRVGWIRDSLEDLSAAALLPAEIRNDALLRSEAAACLAGTDIGPARVLGSSFSAGALAFSPCGRLLAAAQLKAGAWVLPCRVNVYEVPSGKLLHQLRLPPDAAWTLAAGVQDGARSVAFDADGRRLAVGTRSGHVFLWSLDHPARTPVSWATGDGKAISHLAFIPGLNVLCTGCRDGDVLRSWHLESPPRQAARLALPLSTGGLSADPRGRMIACRGGGKVHFLDPVRLEPLLPPRQGSGACCAFGPAGMLLALDEDDAIVLAAPGSPETIQRLREPERAPEPPEGADRIELTRDGSLLMSACYSEETRTIKLWETASGRHLMTLVGGGKDLQAAALSPTGGHLAAASDGVVSLHEVHQGNVSTFLVPQAGQLAGIAASTTSGVVAAVREEAVTLLDSSGQNPPSRLPPLPPWHDRPRPAAFHPCEATLAVGCLDQLAFWKEGRARPVWDFLPASGSRALAFTPRGHRLWAVVRESEVQSWSWPGLERGPGWRNVVFSGLASLYSLAAGDRLVLAGGRDGDARLLGGDDGRLLHALPGPGSPVRSVALSPDETLAVLGTQQGTVRVFRAADGSRLADLEQHTRSVEAVAFSPDGLLLVSGSRDGTLQVHHRNGERLTHLLTLPAGGPVQRALFDDEGRTLIVQVQGEITCRVWHLDRLEQRLRRLGLLSADRSLVSRPSAGSPRGPRPGARAD